MTDTILSQSSSMEHSNELLRCPACGSSMNGPTCTSCDYLADVIDDDIIDLRADRTMDTDLDVEAYDAAHNVKDVNLGLGDVFLELIEHSGLTPQGTLLEIASGSGNLTLALAATGKFDKIISSDISPGFMKLLIKKARRTELDHLLRHYLFDANQLPFEDNQFDFVVGNSVLHHFANFENTIQESGRVLRPGGAALFGEPLFDGQIFTSLIAGSIVKHQMQNGQTISDDQLLVCRILSTRGHQKMKHLNSDRNLLSEIEDKFQFPIQYLREVGRRTGFRDLVFLPPNIKNYGIQTKQNIIRTFKQSQIDHSFLNEYDYLFSALHEFYGKPMGAGLTPLFGHFAYIK